MEIKTEGVPVPYCATCLAHGRVLSPIGAYSEVFHKLFYDTNNYNNIINIQICWECRALLRNVCLFHTKVYRAAELLKHSMLVNSNSCLSTLKAEFTTDDRTIHCTYKEPDQKVLEPKKITIEVAEVKKEDSDNDNDNDVYDDNESDFVDNVKDEVKSEVKLKVNKQKVKKQVYRANTKYKTLKIDEEKSYRRVEIEDVDQYIQRERESKHFTEKPFKCEKCVVLFLNKKLLKIHEKDFHTKGSKSFQCNICKCYFATKSILTRHKKTHYHIYVCNKCNYECYTKKHIRWHLRLKHQRVYQCTECDSEFDNRKDVLVHFKTFHEKFICDNCGVSYKTRKTLEKHIVREHSVFHCDICDKNFMKRKYLTMHNKSKHSGNPENAYCVECDKHFSSIVSYKSHLYETARHRTQKKSFPCPDCGKTFAKKTYLNNHYNHAHLKLGYRCEQCDKSFIRKEHYRRHVRVVHEGFVPPKDKICYVCGRGFSLNRILIHHLRTHTGERPYACQRCPAAFSQRTALVTHTRSVHKEKYVDAGFTIANTRV